MAKNTAYEYLVVESYREQRTSGLHGKIHLRPIEGQNYPTSLRAEGNKSMTSDYPVGTKFKIRAKLTDRQGSGDYLYTSYKWEFEVIEQS